MKTIIFIISFAFTVNAYCQMEFPNGVYLSLEQLRNRTPAFNADFQISKNAEINHDKTAINYNLESNIDSLNRKYIRRKMYAYVRKDSLFINGFHQKIEMDYAIALTKGNFIAFYGRNSNETGAFAGAVGGLVGYTIARLKPYFYVLSLRTGNVRRLTKEYLLARLAEHPNLLGQYNIEPKNDDPDDALLLKYIDLLNQTITD